MIEEEEKKHESKTAKFSHKALKQEILQDALNKPPSAGGTKKNVSSASGQKRAARRLGRQGQMSQNMTKVEPKTDLTKLPKVNSSTAEHRKSMREPC